MPTSALHVARTGLEAQDARMRVIANNLANIGTTGFKRDRVDFATLAYQEQRVAGQASTGQTAFAVGLNLGTGVQVQGTSRMSTQGTLNPTGNVFDLALDGDGFFQVELPPGGQIGFTRAGNFALANDGTLITAQGYALQPPLRSTPRRSPSRLPSAIRTAAPGAPACALRPIGWRACFPEAVAAPVSARRARPPPAWPGPSLTCPCRCTWCWPKSTCRSRGSRPLLPGT